MTVNKGKTYNVIFICVIGFVHVIQEVFRFNYPPHIVIDLTRETYSRLKLCNLQIHHIYIDSLFLFFKEKQ